MGKYDINGASELIFDNLKFLSTKEAAAVLRLSENALRIMVYRGQVPSFKLGSRLRFREKDCLALFERKGT